MGVYFDGEITADDVIDFSSEGSHVLYVAFTVTTPPIRPGFPTDGLDDHHLRIGWFSLGDNFDIGGGATNFWRALEWWNFDDNLWTPLPSTDSGGGGLSVAATRIRYFLFPGTIGHLHIYGT